MIVAQQNEVNIGKLVEMDARCATPSRSGPGQRAHSLRPDGISEDVLAVALQQHGGMIYQGDTQPAVFNLSGWNRGCNSWIEAGLLRTAGQFPAQTVQQTSRLRGTGVVEAGSVKMGRRKRHYT